MVKVLNRERYYEISIKQQSRKSIRINTNLNPLKRLPCFFKVKIEHLNATTPKNLIISPHLSSYFLHR